MRPQKNEYHEFAAAYIDLVPENDLNQAFVNTTAQSLHLFTQLPMDSWKLSYAPGKWSVKELLVHVMDTERIFAYRALCFSRSERQVLPAFEENDYAKHSDAQNREPFSLLKEYEATRRATVELFNSFSELQLEKTGRVPAGAISVKALGYAICGHNLHHLKVMKEKYLK